MSIPAFEDRFVRGLKQLDEIAKGFEFMRSLGEGEKVIEDDEVAALEIGLNADQSDQGGIVEVDIDMNHLFFFPGEVFDVYGESVLDEPHLPVDAGVMDVREFSFRGKSAFLFAAPVFRQAGEGGKAGKS